MAILDLIHASDSRAAGISLILALLAACLYGLYRLRLPTILPGIPYDPKSAHRLMGDLPQLISYMSRPGASFPAWQLDQARKAGNAPIVQVWLGFPRSTKPLVVLADGPETQDVLQRRHREFDRSMVTVDFLGGLLPDHHLLKKSSDPKFRAQRKLLNDLMTPSFLRRVAAPIMYRIATEELVVLWEQKADMADGRPFAAARDIFYFAFEAVLGFSFGSGAHEVLAPQLRALEALGNEDREQLVEGPASRDMPVDFPSVRPAEGVMAVMELTESVERSIALPLGSLYWRLCEITVLRKKRARKENLIQTELKAAVERMIARGADDDSWHRSAVDLIVSREKRFAEKDAKVPDYLSRAIQDEVFGFLVAGHDTSSTALCWAAKVLSRYQHVQSKLRNALRAAWPHALAESRLPTAEEIHDTRVPYLDACMEEIHRHAPAVAGVSRDAIQDTTLLGRFIPNGTTVFMLSKCPGVWTKSFIDHEKEKTDPDATGSRKGTGAWKDEDVDEFIPERWLVPGDDGQLEFDGAAGPMLTFGLGPRGCFGRRLAYIEIRTLLTLMVWRFILEETPEALSGWGENDGLTQKPTQCYVRLKKAY